MARRKAHPLTETPRPNLVLPRKEVAAKLKERIYLGYEIKNMQICTKEDVQQLNLKTEKWQEYNTEYLSRAFDSNSICDQFDSAGASRTI